MREADIQNRILRALCRGTVRLFRNNVGMGWSGRAERIQRAGMIRAEPGDVLVRNARPLHAGLCDGSADLIGWRTVEITEDMVGQRMAVFASVEVKSATGRAAPDQRNWAGVVAAAGGLAGFARSEDEARAILGE